MTEEKQKKNIIDRLWDVFTSVKTAIVLFALIALSSIVGTILEQQAEPAKNIQILSKFFGESLAPSAYNIFEAMGFMDMYGSWWFVAFLMLFAMNLLICTIDRFPAIWKLVKEPVKPLEDEYFEKMPIKRELTLRSKPEKAKEDFLKAAGMKLAEAEAKGVVQLYMERGRFARLGVFITHISIVLILIGAIIGIFFGFKGFVNVPEGTTVYFAFLRSAGYLGEQELNERKFVIESVQTTASMQAAAAKLGVAEDRLRGRMKELGLVPLDFGIRCDDFDVSFYGMSDMPKDYQSTLTVIDGGREALTKTIEVNDPLEYKGVTFYQSSYGVSESSDTEFIIRAVSMTGQSDTKRVHAGEKFNVPGTAIEASITDWSPALSFDESGRPYTYAETMNNPSAQLEINDGGNIYTKWIMKRYQNTWILDGGHLVELVDVWGPQYTGLQVRRDPGVWIVYLGCLVLSLGLYFAFFMTHRRLWVRLAGEKGGTKVSIAATASKNREPYEKQIDKIIALLREGGK